MFLIGVDHRFFQEGGPNQKVISHGADPNHFTPDYFGNVCVPFFFQVNPFSHQGTVWQHADLKNSEIAYAIAKKRYEQSGRHIFDATVDGQCNIFPKVEYEEVFFNEPAGSRRRIVEESVSPDAGSIVSGKLIK